MKLLYPAKITKETGAYLVQFVDFEEAFTEGETLEEALYMAADVLSLVLEQRLADDKPIPTPSEIRRGQYAVAPEASVQAAVLFHLNRGDHSLAEIARAMGTSWASVQRLEKPGRSPSLKQLEKAAAAVGKRLVLSFED